MGISDAPIFSSYAVNAALTGGSGQDFIGGIVGQTRENIVTSHVINTGVVIDSAGNGASTFDSVGGLVGNHTGGYVIASYFIGNATPDQPVSITGGAGPADYVGGLVGQKTEDGIVGSYAIGTGQIDGGTGGTDYVGGLLGRVTDGAVIIRNSYVTLPIIDSGGGSDSLAGLLGNTENDMTISNSYAASTVTDMGGGGSVGALVTSFVAAQSGFAATATYGFGTASVNNPGSTTPDVSTFTRSGDASSATAVPNGAALTATNSSTTAANRWSATIWDFGTTTDSHAPRLYYAQYFLSADDLNSCTFISTSPPGISGNISCNNSNLRHLIPNQQ